MIALYEPHVVETGILATEQVIAINVPRSMLLAAFEDVLAECSVETEESLRERLSPVVETMDRFPLGTWIDPTRGCGCVVGEYLVAADLLDRESASQADVVKWLQARPDSDSLVWFGGKIDIALDAAVAAAMVEEVEEVEEADSVHSLRWDYSNSAYGRCRDVVLFFTEEESA